jgi:hypothetical protein
MSAALTPVAAERSLIVNGAAIRGRDLAAGRAPRSAGRPAHPALLLAPTSWRRFLTNPPATRARRASRSAEVLLTEDALPGAVGPARLVGAAPVVGSDRRSIVVPVVARSRRRVAGVGLLSARAAVKAGGHAGLRRAASRTRWGGSGLCLLGGRGDARGGGWACHRCRRGGRGRGRGHGAQRGGRLSDLGRGRGRRGRGGCGRSWRGGRGRADGLGGRRAERCGPWRRGGLLHGDRRRVGLGVRVRVVAGLAGLAALVLAHGVQVDFVGLFHRVVGLLTRSEPLADGGFQTGGHGRHVTLDHLDRDALGVALVHDRLGLDAQFLGDLENACSQICSPGSGPCPCLSRTRPGPKGPGENSHSQRPPRMSSTRDSDALSVVGAPRMAAAAASGSRGPSLPSSAPARIFLVLFCCCSATSLALTEATELDGGLGGVLAPAQARSSARQRRLPRCRRR